VVCPGGAPNNGADYNARDAHAWQGWVMMSLYRGREGMWAFLLHRVTGVAVVLFLSLHIIDTALVGFGPEVYDSFVAIYHNPVSRVLEVLLGAALLYHAGNGIRVTLIDFWPRGAHYQRTLFYIGLVLFPLIFLPAAYLMLRPLFL